MNIAEKFNEKKRIEQQEQEVKRQQKVKALSDKILSALSTNETIESIENYLLENGSVSITDFGCLCQDGFCDWQRGLKNMLQPLIQDWEMKGVQVRPSLNLDFSVKKNYFSHNLNRMTIEGLKKWNASKKE